MIGDPTINLEKMEALVTKLNSKVSSTDNTCYLIYKRTWVTTPGPGNDS